MRKNLWNALKAFIRLACWVFIAVLIMRVAEHFGASQVEAGCGTVVAVIAYLWSLFVDGLSEMAPEFDQLIREWKSRGAS
jgi:hypothetical protein